MPTTIAYHAFEQKLIYFDDDIELIDVLRTGVLNGDLTNPETNHLLKNVDPIKHRHLARRRNSDGSRRNTINHLRASIYSSYIKDVYEEVTEYLRNILEQASRNGFNSGRIVGEHSFKMDAKTVLALGTWENVCDTVASSIFQSLEAERSTLSLITKMANKLALNIDQALIDAALPFLEVRHFLVHTDGRLSRDFMDRYPNIRNNNGLIALDYALITGVRDSVKALISAFDQEVVAGNIVAAGDLRP